MDVQKGNRLPVPWITAVIVGGTVAIHAMAVGSSLEFRREGSIAGYLTCHLAHYSGSHLAWSVGVFAALGAIAEMRSRCRMIGCVVAASIVIPLAVEAFSPSLERYRGMSGIDTALFMLIAIDLAKENRRIAWASGILMAGLAGKLVFEQWTHAAVFADSSGGGFVPAPVAHLAGAAAGVVWALMAGRGPALHNCNDIVGQVSQPRDADIECKRLLED